MPHCEAFLFVNSMACRWQKRVPSFGFASHPLHFTPNAIGLDSFGLFSNYYGRHVPTS